MTRRKRLRARARLRRSDRCRRSPAATAGDRAWVLFKLDGGLDHILIDEAQDTNPEQWEIVAASPRNSLPARARASARARSSRSATPSSRSSAFSAPTRASLRAMREHFDERMPRAERGLRRRSPLDISFRSTPPVLRRGRLRSSAQAEAARRRRARRRRRSATSPPRPAMPGRVELWPPVSAADAEDRHAAGRAPTRRAARRRTTRLARAIAAHDHEPGSARRAAAPRDGRAAACRRHHGAGAAAQRVRRRPGARAEAARRRRSPAPTA